MNVGWSDKASYSYSFTIKKQNANIMLIEKYMKYRNKIVIKEKGVEQSHKHTRNMWMIVMELGKVAWS